MLAIFTTQFASMDLALIVQLPQTATSIRYFLFVIREFVIPVKLLQNVILKIRRFQFVPLTAPVNAAIVLLNVTCLMEQM